MSLNEFQKEEKFKRKKMSMASKKGGDCIISFSDFPPLGLVELTDRELVKNKQTH